MGAYFIFKKPPGISPGGGVKCHFAFDYSGAGGPYVLQVWFGSDFPAQWFVHVFGCTMEVVLPGPGKYAFDLICAIPLGTDAKKYDAEALIRTPEMSEFDYLIKRVSDGVIEVREG